MLKCLNQPTLSQAWAKYQEAPTASKTCKDFPSFRVAHGDDHAELHGYAVPTMTPSVSVPQEDDLDERIARLEALIQGMTASQAAPDPRLQRIAELEAQMAELTSQPTSTTTVPAEPRVSTFKYQLVLNGGGKLQPGSTFAHQASRKRGGKLSQWSVTRMLQGNKVEATFLGYVTS